MPSRKLVYILLHILCTALIVVVPIFIMPLKDAEKPNYLQWHTIIFTALQTVAFYFNAYVLYPRLLLKKRVAAYILAVLGISVLFALVPGCIMVFSGEMPMYAIFAGIVVKIFIGLFVSGTATSYRFMVDVIRDQRKQQESLAMELSFLRSQVSPHFMFNALNSMVSLARKKSDLLEPALLKMSNLMHYMLYDSDEEKVSLHKEVEYIRSYIDLQTMRFGDSVKVLFMVQPGNYSHVIEPMLLIPLIENAFKHGVNVAEEPEINIRLAVSEKEVSLSVSNKTIHYNTQVADKTKGIGLVNLERRLKILYPGKHQLYAQKNNNWFHASLKIVTHD
ncbi:histidine kinase [Niastella caeni]|uniref:Histidine kinase n=1 Tax=Niastella caeni TaxID=2569763 RepID=A0A4S8H958_9BACT|nr:histidine kinase [Niastella caeni]THU31177.1 histidine kinase [Niastella caeni]